MLVLRSTSRLTATASLRPLTVRCLAPSTSFLPTRSISSSLPVRADLNELGNMAKAFANSPLYDAMKKNPATILALKDAAQAAMKKGVDVTSPPSKMTMLSLAFDTEFRTAIEKLMAELSKAGIDVTPSNLQNMLSAIKNPNENEAGEKKKDE